MPDFNDQRENAAPLNLLYEIGRVLASAETMAEAAPQILEAICRNLNFELGELWRVGSEGKFLTLENVWHLPLPELKNFTARSRLLEFAEGDGLPGKVWAQNTPVWIENISLEESIPRKSFIEEIAMQSAFAFPILLGDKFLGVFTFFCRQSYPHDAELLKIFAAVGNHIGQFIKREQTETHLRESENRYRAFITQSTEGIWRFELDEKIPVNLPADEQVRRAFEFGYLAECNDAMARMYGLERAEELVGSRISDLLDMTDEANVEYVRAFVESGYHLIDAESHEKDARGGDKFFLNSLIGTVEDGNLVRVWGTQRDITERKDAERAVLASEESYRIVAETASDAIIKIDEENRVLFVNRSFERVFGYKVEEVLGQSLAMIMPEDLRERHRAGFLRYLETGERYLSWEGIEIPALHKDGHIFPLEISFGEYNQTGERFFIGIARDISERKRAEEISDRYRLLSSKARDVILFLQPDGKIVEANQAAVETYGYEYQQLLEMNLKDLRAPETWHFIAEHLEKANSGGIQFETVHRRRDGTTFPAEVSSTGASVGGERLLMSIIRDVTQRRRAEEKMRESQESLRLATGAARMYSWELDLQTQKTRFSENFSHVVGFAEQITTMDAGTIFQKLIHPNDLEKSRRYIERAAKLKGSHSIETRLVNPASGEIVWIETTSYTVRDRNGTPVRIVGVSQNITERKSGEEVLLERERLAILNADISEALIQNDALTEILRSCTDALIRHLDAAFARIWTFNKTESVLELQASSGIYTHLDGKHSRVPLGAYKIGWIAAERQPHLTNSVIGDARVSEQEWAVREGMTAFAGYPLIVGEQLVGVVAMFARQPLTEQTLDALASVANTIALGIERKQGEEKMRESEANFRQLAETVPQFVWVTETDGSLSYANRQWLEFSGLTLEQTNDPNIIGEIFYRDDRERLAKSWEEAFASAAPLEIELRMQNRQGEYCWFLTRSVPVKDASGTVLKWFGTSTDITENKQAENRLALLAEISELTRKYDRADELLYAVAKALGEHLAVSRCLFNEIDLDGDRETVHRDYCRGVESVAGVHKISDYSPVTSAEMTAGKTVVNADSKTDSRTAPDYEKVYAPSGERAYVAVPLLRENRWVASLWVSDAAPRRWNKQEISLLETVAERTWSVVENLRIDAALLKAERKAAEDYQALLARIVPLGQILGRARDLISVYRAIFEFVRTSMPCSSFFVSFYDAEKKLRIAAYAWGEGVEMNIGNLPPMPIAEAGGANSQAVLSKKTVITNHYWDSMKNRPHIVLQDNGIDPNSSLVVPMTIKDEAIGTLEVQAHENEAFNREQAVALEMVANLAAVAIENVRLLEVEAKAREIAERANHAKDEFIAVVSHELRSPLNAMLGWTRILQKQKTDEKTTEYALDVIVRNARAQSKLIEDLLDIARIGEKKLRLDIQPTELAPIINQAVEIIKPTAEAKKIVISQSLDRGANFIAGDDDRLRQVIENLLSNAVKFTPGGGQISVRLERERSRAKIIISDNGQGIPAEFLPQIFERFKQADLSTTRRHGGLGIGLSLAQDLVELHGGTISAESAGEGKGATFIVRLPLRMIAPIKENSSKVEFMDSQGKLSGFWILAVDDEADAREIVSFMLQINGAKVTTANSAVEALDILKNSGGRLPDILLSDISMPNESGYALLEKIRALPRENGGQIPAVALTAFNRPEDRQSAFEAGFQKHLGKPVEMDDLISAIIETAAKH